MSGLCFSIIIEFAGCARRTEDEAEGVRGGWNTFALRPTLCPSCVLKVVDIVCKYANSRINAYHIKLMRSEVACGRRSAVMHCSLLLSCVALGVASRKGIALAETG
mgnify:CR=1